MNDEATSLYVFSPLPPAQNGIADYCFNLLKPLREYFRCRALVADAQAEPPAGVDVLDHEQAFRYIKNGSNVLHQIGNNPGHIYVLAALRAWGGVTTLHDQNLHYLYESADTEVSTLVRMMVASGKRPGLTYGSHLRELGIKTAANYAMFDMLHEVLELSSSVVVHSQFAKRKIEMVYGSAKAAHVYVIPHLALPFEASPTPEVRDRLRLSDQTVIILTAGFATSAKRFDWLIAALDELCLQKIDFFWIHAGRERPEEFNLSSLLDGHPVVKERMYITGYLTEDQLNKYIESSDIVVNLRFPSVGESSGSLARAMSMGKCCLVSDTAAYSELPPNSAVHISIDDPVKELADSLIGLCSNSNIRSQIGQAARDLAESEWIPAKVAAAYAEVLRHSSVERNRRELAYQFVSDDSVVQIDLAEGTDRSHVEGIIGATRGRIKVLFGAPDSTALARLSLNTPELLRAILPEHFAIDAVRLRTQSSYGLSDRFSESVVLEVRGTLP